MKNSTFVSNATGADKILLHKFSTHALKRGSIIMTNSMFLFSVIFVFKYVFLLVMSTDCSHHMP